jgi:hypothetical protein
MIIFVLLFATSASFKLMRNQIKEANKIEPNMFIPFRQNLEQFVVPTQVQNASLIFYKSLFCMFYFISLFLSITSFIPIQVHNGRMLVDEIGKAKRNGRNNNEERKMWIMSMIGKEKGMESKKIPSKGIFDQIGDFVLEMKQWPSKFRNPKKSNLEFPRFINNYSEAAMRALG